MLGLDRRVALYSLQFVRMFRLPIHVLERNHADALIAAIIDQLADPQEFLDQSRVIWAAPSAESFSVLRFKDGRVFERFVAPHRIGARFVGLVASFRDVSQSLRTEHALKENRALLKKAQEVAHVGSWVAELDGSDRLTWSAETHRIFGVPLGEFIGTTESFFQVVHEDDRPQVRAATEAAVSGGAPYSIEHRIMRADGNLRWVVDKVDIERDPDGHPIRTIGTVQDITERRQLEEQFRQAQKMEAIGRLAVVLLEHERESRKVGPRTGRSNGCRQRTARLRPPHLAVEAGDSPASIT